MTAYALSGRTAMITGGSDGIGREIVRLLLAKGSVRVVVVGRNPEKLAAAHAEFGKAVLTYRAGLSEVASVDRLIAELPSFAPELSLLVNNAGTQLLTDLTGADSSAPRQALRWR
jgi:uncharacterized oxidoreductase